ncbi:MAG TPA: MFS transporter, partial [Micromonosporaceae bacterium]|nr:MFS transporter [Micromonosporaceae bacterium]
FAALVVLVAVAGGVRGAADCANSALVPATAQVGHIPLERAAGLNSGTNRLALLLGAPLGGVLVALTNPAVAVAVDAVSFLVAALVVFVFVRGVTVAPAPSPAAADTTGEPEKVGAVRRYGRDLAEGIRFLGRDRLLLGICVMVAASNLLDQGMSAVLLPVWVKQELHSAAALGLLGGALGLGAVIGNLLGAWLGPRVPRRMLYGWGFLLGATPRFLVLVVASTLSPVFITFLIADIFGGSINSVIGATAYERIPPHLLPRVLGVVRASAWIGIPFGALVAGLVTDATGVRTAALTGAVCMLATTLAPFVFPAWREMRRPAPTDTPAPDEATAPAQRAAEPTGTAKA